MQPAGHPRVALLIASTGGHLAQLHELAPRIEQLEGMRVVWVTFDTPQSRSLLRDQEVVYVYFTQPRDVKHVLTNLPRAAHILRRLPVELVVSTGSAIALSFLPLARARGIECHYVESAARGAGPSVTGQIVSRLPGLRAYTQYPSWADDRWQYRGSVFDGYVPVERPYGHDPRRLVVTLGTIPYPFERLLRRIRDIVPDGVEVLYQTGVTPVGDLGLQCAMPEMAMAELTAELRVADVVVSHAGIGSALGALDAGRVPVLVPRESSRGEHVDDHQRQIAVDLDGRGLALHRRVEELTWDDLRHAGRRSVTTTGTPPPISLDA